MAVASPNPVDGRRIPASAVAIEDAALVVATIRAVGARVKLPVPAATLTGRGTIAAAVLCGATSADAAGARTVCAVTVASAVITAMPAGARLAGVGLVRPCGAGPTKG